MVTAWVGKNIWVRVTAKYTSPKANVAERVNVTASELPER